MDPILFVFAILGIVISLLLLSLVIRGAIDSSEATKQMKALVEEVRLLRKEIQDSKHIIDKRL
ncbi:hypothetical protein [Paenibacillus arenilitoris]|uniref:Uncharacterized protein n=1 Tax=Paenibacillus arenilitoris TaxID=2772299 RepID=A0A927H8D8_9BACL|nr:hypothetical protein [Paenibacillus arenilitoris]MBD2871457.1 hypothetical protein [Paenibacillus arenilitoris]